MLKNKIQNYIILEFLKNYATLLFIFSLVIWLMQAIRLLDLIYQDGNTFVVYIQYTIFQLPKIISRISIVVFLIAVFWTISNLEDSNEINTIPFFGIDPKALFFNLVKFSLILTFILIFLRVFIVPYFNHKSKELLLGEGIGAFSSLIKKKNFNNPAIRTTIFVEDKNKIGELKNIIFFQQNENGINKIIIAKEGIVANVKNESYFISEYGIIHETDPNGNISQINFDKITTDLRSFKKKSADYYKIQELFFPKLLNKFFNDKNIIQKLGSLSELLRMFLAPLIIPSLLLLISTLFLSKEYKINKKIIKICLFAIAFLLLFILEYLLMYSSKKIFFGYAVFFYLITLFILNLYIANKSFKNATI